MKCAVGKCKQSNSKKTNVSFYNFPKNAAQRKLWVKFCNRYKPIDVRKDKICSLHFKEEDFERNLIFEMGFSNRRAPKLKPGAVPTIDSTIDNEIEIPNQFDNEIEIPTQFDNEIEIPTQFEIKNEIPTQFEIKKEIPTQFEIKNEIPNEFEIENEIPTQFEIENEIPTQFEIKNEIPNEFEIENEIPTQFEINNEIPTQFEIKNEIPNEFEIENEIPTQFEIENEIPTQFEIKNEIPNEFEIENEIPTQFEIENEIPNQFEINNEIPTQFEIKNEIPNEFEIENEIPTQFEIENEIPTQFEIKNEIPNEFEIENEIPTQFEIENEIPTQFEINNEIPTQFEIKNEIPNQMDIPNTPMTTDIKEYSREQYIKTLEMQIDALRQENGILKTAQSQSAITIKNLSCKVQSLSFANLNFEKALRSLFTKDQIKKLKRGDKKQNFTGADSTSAKAYKFLRKKPFPIPSVRTLQRWSVILGPVVKILYAANQMSETTKLRILSFDEMKAKKKSCYDKPTYFMLVPANYIQLYNYFIILAFPLQPGQKIFFTRQKLPTISHITPVNKNVGRNVKLQMNRKIACQRINE